MADTASASPVVSVIIPHYLGDILSDCLKTIYEAEEPTPFEVIVADDQPHNDGSIERALENEEYIQVKCSRSLASAVTRSRQITILPKAFQAWKRSS
jgi:glycosyltransferase involved in cell wall biosynthesis